MNDMLSVFEPTGLLPHEYAEDERAAKARAADELAAAERAGDEVAAEQLTRMIDIRFVELSKASTTRRALIKR